MTLKERILNRKRTITKEDLERAANSESSKRFDKFLSICKRLDSQMDLSNISCDRYKDVFELIEKHYIDISDIIPIDEYPEYKQLMIEDKVQMAPPIGKMPDKIYDLNDVDDYIAYTDIQREKNRCKYE